MTIMDGLNPQQQQAVSHTTGPLLVVAGAGTGKTQVITRRIAHLIAENLAKPSEILALTFTEKAAREMADRLYGLIGWQSFQVPVMTFNAFGSELLGRFASHIGRSTRGGLLNTTQKSLLLQQHFSELKLQYYGPQADLYGFCEGIIRYIERLQNGGITVVAYRRFVDQLEPETGRWHRNDLLEQQDLAAMYELYESIKTTTGTYDYSDQLAIPLAILQDRPNLAERLAAQYRYVLVDEYQDTSPVQDGLLRTFLPRGGNIFAVGDDDQAIYGFRGADITNILDFASHFGVKKPSVLIENYRSGQPILDAAYRLINHNNPERLEARLALNKRLRAQTPTAEVAFKPYRNPAEEQVGIIDDIGARIAAGLEPAQVAVLARSNAVLKAFAKGLRQRGISFALSTEVNIFEQRELINLWYLLEWLGQRASQESIGHLIMGPFIGWSPAQYRPVLARAKAELMTPEEALRLCAEEGDEAAEQLVAQLDTWRGWANQVPISQLAYRLVFETGLAERLSAAAQDSWRIIRVFEDLQLLLSQMQDYEAVAVDPLLAGYLATFPKPPALEAAEALGDAAGVQLLTVHASKGLEFDTVYVANVTARAWSNSTSGGLLPPPELMPTSQLPPEHEQRRLMYVAATRAKQRLILSAPLESAGGQRQPVSPLVAELLGDEPQVEMPAPAVSTVDKAMQKLQRFYPLKTALPRQRLSFETEEGWIELGVGALDAYRRCPHEFYLQYVLGISQPFGPQLALGTALHGAIQAYYEARLRGEQLSVDEVLLRLDELWSNRGYESRELAEAARGRAQAALRSFVQREDRLQRQVLGSELPITLELAEAKLRLRGRIDAYFQTTEGVEIRDFKTGLKRDPQKLAADAKDNFQLRTYALAYQAMTGMTPAAVTLDYVVTGVEGSAALTGRILANHQAKLGELAQRIRARDFAPAPLSEFHHCAAFTYYGEELDETETNTRGGNQ